MNNTKKNDRLTILYILLALVFIVMMREIYTVPETRQVIYSEFTAEVRAGHVDEIKITERELIGTLKPDIAKARNEKAIKATRLPGIDDPALLKDLQTQQVKIAGEIVIQNGWFATLIEWLLPFIIMFGFYSFAIRGMGQGAAGALDFNKNKAKIYDRSGEQKVTFADVAGVDEAKVELVEIVDFLKNAAKYQRLGGRIPKGVLLVGPPGTGKTLLAKAVSGEAGVPFFSISGSEFIEMFVGVGAARVRDLFEQAKKQAPCIIFIDELDAIGKSRSAGRAMLMSHDEREQTLNQLLSEMDGFDSSRGVIIMAATNTPEVLDPALLRAGRFDRQVVVDRPDLQGREAILKVHSKNVKLAENVDLKIIAARTPGMVGSDLANLINEAALLAARCNAESVKMSDLEEAIDRVMLGLEKKSRVMDAEEKRRVAYHETGHALVALSVEHAEPVHRISIIPRSIGALGHTLQLPTQEKFLHTRQELQDKIAVLLGGRAAEEIIFAGDIATGAADDLEKASDLIRRMITQFGMSDSLGPLTYGKSFEGRFISSPLIGEERNYSEHTAEQIDTEVRNFVEKAYQRAKSILLNRRMELELITRELIQKETLNHADIECLIASPTEALAALKFEIT